MRKLLLLFIVLSTGLLFMGRLFYLQIYDTYAVIKSENNAIKVEYDYPQRGHIYDRNNKLLVSNQPSYDLMAIPKDIKPFDTLGLCKLLGIEKEKKLPEVLSLSEIKELLQNITNLKHKALLSIIYSSGLRIGEALNLKLADIDSKRMLISIKKGKGKKDRVSLLSPKILELLRDYYKAYKPNKYLNIYNTLEFSILV